MLKDKYSIHKFSKKLLQKPIFPHLKNYILWQAKNKKIKSEDFAPISINLDLIAACNYKCQHCIDHWYYDGKKLEFSYVKRLLSDWHKKGLRSVIVIGGGEPTLHPDFERIIRFLKGLSLQVGIVSNGSCIERLDKISSLLREKDWIRLSLDSGTDETFKKIHNSNFPITLDEIMKKVKKMRQKNSDFQMGYSFLVIGSNKKVNNMSLVNNIGEISLAAKLAKENGFNYLSIKPFIDPVNHRKTELAKEDLKKIRKETEKAKRIENKNFKVIESINLLCFFDKNLKRLLQKQPKICHAQFFRLVVAPFGISLCSLWRGFNNTRIIETNQKITPDYYKRFHKNRIKTIETFDACKVCGQTTCLYSPFNDWVQDFIDAPEKIKNLKPIDDFNDYFL